MFPPEHIAAARRNDNAEVLWIVLALTFAILGFVFAVGGLIHNARRRRLQQAARQWMSARPPVSDEEFSASIPGVDRDVLALRQQLAEIVGVPALQIYPHDDLSEIVEPCGSHARVFERLASTTVSKRLGRPFKCRSTSDPWMEESSFSDVAELLAMLEHRCDAELKAERSKGI